MQDDSGGACGSLSGSDVLECRDVCGEPPWLGSDMGVGVLFG